MPVDEFHQALAVIVLQVASEYGFVVAGGNALIKHGIVDRYTADIVMWSVKVSRRKMSQPGTGKSSGR